MKINFIAKAPGLPDAPVIDPGRPFQPFGGMSINRPEVHGFLKEMNREVLSQYDCFAWVFPTSSLRSLKFEALASAQETKRYRSMHRIPYRVIGSFRWSSTFISTFSRVSLAESSSPKCSQSFDRAGGGLQREFEPNWKLSAVKKVFNTWQVEMEQGGGWNSN